MMSLHHLMSTMPPLSVAETTTRKEASSGPSASDLVPLEIYRRALEPNLVQSMALLYPGLPLLVERYEPGLWSKLVHQFAAQSESVTPQIDAMGPGFVRFLELRRLQGAPQGRWIEECADYLACQLRAATSGDIDGDSDGLGRRLFIRRYGYPVDRLLADPRHCELPDGVGAPTTRVIYRSWVDRRVYIMAPRPAHLFAISRRDPTLLISDLGSAPSAVVDEAERWLVEQGVLRDPAGAVHDAPEGVTFRLP